MSFAFVFVLDGCFTKKFRKQCSPQTAIIPNAFTACVIAYSDSAGFLRNQKSIYNVS